MSETPHAPWVDPRSLAELAWLAARIDILMPLSGAANPSPLPAPPASGSLGVAETQNIGQPGDKPEQGALPSASSTVSPVERVEAVVGDTEGAQLHGRLRAPRGWSSDRELRRALHGWGQWMPIGPKALDLEATVRRMAQTREPFLVHRAIDEQGGDLLVLEDRSIAMAPFVDAVIELVAAARASGGFQRVVHLGFDGRDDTTLLDARGRIVDVGRWPLQRAVTSSVGWPGRSLLVLLVSDGLDPAVVDGRLLETLQALVAVPAKVAWIHPWGEEWGVSPAGQTVVPANANLLKPRGWYGSESLRCAAKNDTSIGIPVVGLDAVGLQALTSWFRGRHSPAIAWAWPAREDLPPVEERAITPRDLPAEDDADERIDVLDDYLTPDAKIILGLAAALGVARKIDAALLQVIAQAAFGIQRDARLGIAQALASGLLSIDRRQDEPPDAWPVLVFTDTRYRSRLLDWTDHEKLAPVFKFLVEHLTAQDRPHKVDDWGRRLGINVGLARRLAKGERPTREDVASLDGDGWETLSIVLGDASTEVKAALGAVQPMVAREAQKILEAMRVRGWPGVYLLGSIDRHVTIYRQQVSALNLAAALVASGRAAVGETVVVVGAGVAGLTCAAGLRRLGAEVVVLEAQDQILSLFRGGSTRWLHPRVYEWPLDGWDRDRAGLPLLDWEHGTVEAVQRQLEQGWAEAGKGIDVFFGVRDVRVGAAGDELRTVTWNASGGKRARTKTVVLAVGFGLEATPLPTEKRYWEADDLDEPCPADGKPRRWLVSGCGDGALTDLFRLCIEGFRHDQMLADSSRDPRMEDVRAEIRRIEGNAEIQYDPARLHDAYEAIEANWVIEAMTKRARRHQVKLAAPKEDFLTHGASPINRFLAAQLLRAERFELVPSKVASVEPDGAGVVVRYTDGTIGRFDRIQRRHGPESALARGLPAIAKAVENDEKYRRSKPTLTDQVRQRLWIEGVFGPEVRSNGNGGKSAATSATPVPPTSSPSVGDFELARYLAKIEFLHSELRLAGFETKVRVPIGLEELYEPLDAAINRSARREQVFEISEEAVGRGANIEHVFKTSEEAVEQDVSVEQVFGTSELAVGHDASIELARAFERAPGRGVVLLGDPGSGKTTHLKQVLLQIVRKGPESIGLPAETVPVFLPLRRLRDLDAGLPGFITQELRDPLLDVDVGFGQRLCKRGKLLFLLDGLDEVANAEDRRRVARWIEAARRANRDNYFLVSCRFSGYALDAQLDEGFLELHLRPMSPVQVERFVRKWYGIVERATHSDPAQADVKAKAGADDLLATLRKPEMRSARVYTMTHNPLLLTAICLVHRDRGTLPTKRVVLYEETVSVMLERWRRVTKELEVTFPAREALQVLMPVAEWMHEESGRIRAKVAELEAPIVQGLAAIGRTTVPARTFLETIRDESGLLTGWGVDEFGFMHLGFQEYLVARSLRARSFDDHTILGRLAARFGDVWWQEVILLLLSDNDPPMFRRFMSEVVMRAEFPEWARSELMGLCWSEAFGVSAEPFVDLLKQTGRDATLVVRQLAAAELLTQRMPKVEGLEALLREHPADDVRRWWRARARQAERLVDVVAEMRPGDALLSHYANTTPSSRRGKASQPDTPPPRSPQPSDPALVRNVAARLAQNPWLTDHLRASKEEWDVAATDGNEALARVLLGANDPVQLVHWFRQAIDRLPRHAESKKMADALLGLLDVVLPTVAASLLSSGLDGTAKAAFPLTIETVFACADGRPMELHESRMREPLPRALIDIDPKPRAYKGHIPDEARLLDAVTQVLGAAGYRGVSTVEHLSPDEKIELAKTVLPHVRGRYGQKMTLYAISPRQPPGARADPFVQVLARTLPGLRIIEPPTELDALDLELFAALRSLYVAAHHLVEDVSR